MQMSQAEALSFIGSLLMKMMGVLLVVADSVVIGEPQRAYIMQQRKWYEQQQDMMNTAEQVDELIYHGYEQAAVEAWESVKAWNSRAERTCHIEWRDDSYDTDAGYEPDGVYFCTACGADLPHSLQECWDDYQAGHCEKPFNYCPNCGCKVVN